ncbi:hypothetical protein [Bacillus anthracis]|nr:hypothetical protein [Bacillus anthracis]
MFSKSIVLVTVICLSSVICMNNLYQSHYDKEIADDHLPGEHFYVEM